MLNEREKKENVLSKISLNAEILYKKEKNNHRIFQNRKNRANGKGAVGAL